MRKIFFLFLHENVCGYSLEAPHRGTSNEYPQHMISSRNKENINNFWLKKVPYLELWIMQLHIWFMARKSSFHRERVRQAIHASWSGFWLLTTSIQILQIFYILCANKVGSVTTVHIWMHSWSVFSINIHYLTLVFPWHRPHGYLESSIDFHRSRLYFFFFTFIKHSRFFCFSIKKTKKKKHTTDSY